MEGQRFLSNRTSWKVSDVHIVRYTWVFCLCLSVSLSVSLCVCLCLCVLCVVVVLVVGGEEEGGRERRERGERRETNRTIWLLIPSAVSLGIAGVEQPYQVKPMIGGIGDMLFSIYSQT